MCFTPAISLATALIEFAAVILIVIKFKKNKHRIYLASFIFLLGLYQFSEFLLCKNPSTMWAKLGFIAYNFLPATGLHYWLKFSKRKTYTLIIYFIPVAAALYAIFNKNFITSFTCEKFYIIVKNQLFASPLLPIYEIYYFGFLALILVQALLDLKKEKNRKKKIQMLALAIALIVTILPPIILMIFIPSTGSAFPSIYCHFAIGFTLYVLISYYLDN